VAKISDTPLPPDDPIFSRGLISVFGRGPVRPKPEPEEASDNVDREDD
jgi:hypothetical protein